MKTKIVLQYLLCIVFLTACVGVTPYPTSLASTQTFAIPSTKKFPTFTATSAPLTATQTLRPAPTSELTESKIAPSHAAFVASNTTYANEYYNFAVDYPSDVNIYVQSDGPFQLIVYTDPKNPFYIRATKDFLPSDVAYFLDTSPIAETKYGTYVWQTYYLPNGYGDAVGFSPPIYALQMQTGDVLYTIVIFNQDSLTELQAHILSTFRILNNSTPTPRSAYPKRTVESPVMFETAANASR